MRRQRNIFIPLISILAICGLFWACENDDIDILDTPAIMFPLPELHVDLNLAKQPAVTAVVNSKTGLKSVKTFITYADGEQKILEQPYTKFFNPNSFSVTLNPIYTEYMKGFKVVVEDIAGQVEEATLSLNIIALRDAPQIAFYDQNNIAMETITYDEGDPTPYIRIGVSSEEELQYIVLRQIVNGQEKTIEMDGEDTLKFSTPTMQHSFNLQDITGYTPLKGLTSYRVYTAAGTPGRLKTKVGRLAVNFVSSYPIITFTSEEESLNGMAINSAFNITGDIYSERGLKEIKLTPINNKGIAIGTAVTIPKNNENNAGFDEQFTTTEPLAYIRVQATDIKDRVTLDSIRLHVGYKYHRLEATLAVASEVATNPGAYLSAVNGMMYSSCDAKENNVDVDACFSSYSSNTRITLVRLGDTTGNKALGNCRPYDTSSETNQTDNWVPANIYALSIATTIKRSNFDNIGLTEIKSATGGTGGKVVYLTDGSYSTANENVALYTNRYGKKVLLTYDSLVKGNGAEAQFFIKVKVQL